MTKLVVEDLQTTLEQDFTVYLERRITVAGIRPYIYMHNSPSGTFTFTLKRAGVTIASDSFDSTEIKSDLGTTDNYIHIWKVLNLANVIHLESGAYSLELSSSGYTYSDSSYLGWVKEHEHLTSEINGSPLTDFNNPMSIQLFELKDN